MKVFEKLYMCYAVVIFKGYSTKSNSNVAGSSPAESPDVGVKSSDKALYLHCLSPSGCSGLSLNCDGLVPHPGGVNVF